MLKEQIGFIGGGNMARAIIGGILQEKLMSPAQIHCVDRNTDKREKLTQDWSIKTHAEISPLIEKSHVIILAIKPKDTLSVMKSIAPQLKQPLIISVVAGITTDQLSAVAPLSIIRCMPNTPSLVGEGLSGLYANARVTEAQKNLAEQLFKAVGETAWFDKENDLDNVTAISGSGPAYFYLFMQGLRDAGIQLGLTPEVANTLAIQTALGAAKMAKSGAGSLETLRQQVTSPGGTTEKAIASFEAHGLRSLIETAALAAKQRAHELQQQES